jgi:peptidoglycan/LPS O-acetylase OafA/YrhL
LRQGRFARCAAGSRAGAGVDLFFVISGFIMVYASERCSAEPARRGSFCPPACAHCPALLGDDRRLHPVFPRGQGRSRPPGISAGSIVASFLFVPYPRTSGEMFPCTIWADAELQMFFYAVFACAIVLSRRNAILAITALFITMVAANMVWGPFPQPLAFWFEPNILGVLLRHAGGDRLPRGPALAGPSPAA